MAPFQKLLIANRGEIAVRISRAASELAIETVAVFSRDDAAALHVRKTDDAVALDGTGPSAYLDLDGIVAAAQGAGCDALHPGYGFLSESADLADRCAHARLRFIGPGSGVLALFGDKVRSRELAARCAIPVPEGTTGPTTVAQARELLASLETGGAIMIKALSGGGGRGMRMVERVEELEDAFARSQSEALVATGRDEVYVERLIPRARHVEVQVAGDRTGALCHFHERECTIQRRHQKLIEVAPAPSLAGGLRDRLVDAALRLAAASALDSLATVEFLVDADGFGDDDGMFVFIEVNPRLQVEHTVTEEVTGVDLVKTQLLLAGGHTLAELGIASGGPPPPRGFAMQLRVNMESTDHAGRLTPTGGTLSVIEPPSGPGIRTDTSGYAGYRPSPAFDSLLAKLIVHSPTAEPSDLLRRARRALAEFRIEGIETNIPLLAAILDDPDVEADRIHTRFVEERLPEIMAAVAAGSRRLFHAGGGELGSGSVDWAASAAPPGTHALTAGMRGIVQHIHVTVGDPVVPGQPVVVVEAMKMEHILVADAGGIVRAVPVESGETVEPETALLFVELADIEGEAVDEAADVDPDAIRPDLSELRNRKHGTLDRARPAAVAKRHATRHRTARENVADLVDPGSFLEYGPLVLPAQQQRRTHAELVRMGPADGLVTGLASINGNVFDEARARAMVLAYDWTVFAGTQGVMAHKKTERVLSVAERLRLPIVLFAEGGGGRPGDFRPGPAGLEMLTFWRFARQSGLAPTVGLASRYCFAGNAALLGCCDVIIATADANIGMAGPAMVEGGGLGVVHPTEIGPAAVQSRNGVIDLLVDDDAQAVAAAKLYLSYFQGNLSEWECADQRALRRAVPENRMRIYDVRKVVALLADTDSVLELRPSFAPGVVTALIRIEGRPLGLIANNPQHLGGAIDADGADKGARFMRLCDAYGLPIVSLADTPGFMVGPDAEAKAQVRHVSRLFVTAANLDVPMFVIVLRKGYGLGAQAATGGSFHAPAFIVSWPTGEFGGMGFEGYVRLAYRRELEAIEDPRARQAEFERLVAEKYERGRAISMAEHFELDDVIDPADSRRWIVGGLRSIPPDEPGADRKRRPFVDTW